jgi:protease I
MAAKKSLMLVTAPAWPAHSEWMRKFLQLLGSRIEP